ncbi:GNAT family N-acetyltransferase [Streptomyces sp. NPDC101118]|uniref:GNAT family N-acetyltransferase n=1 Tax=Streptomyces sp. NPDC101118 TaxID=3366109 RepID=UPI0038301A84
MIIQPLSEAALRAQLASLADLTLDTVAGGNSLGFLAGVGHAEAAAWWESLLPAVSDGTLTVWTALDGDRVAGTVSLRRETKPNGRHRAEVNKLMVHRAARGRGLARALLAELERHAAHEGLVLLHLDTETGSPAEGLYRALGWQEAGTVPDFAADPAGVLHPTTIFYKSAHAPAGGGPTPR